MFYLLLSDIGKGEIEVISKLAVWYLRVRKKAVIINMKVGKGYVQSKAKNRDTHVCDNDFAVPFITKGGKRAELRGWFKP